jgi:hypothetical protein
LTVDIGDGVLRAGSYSSKFSIVGIRDASVSLKDLANLLDNVRVKYTLSEGTISLISN